MPVEENIGLEASAAFHAMLDLAEDVAESIGEE